jgi:hypothetical protein
MYSEKMNTDSVVRNLFRSLETTLHERLSMIEDILRMSQIHRDEDGSSSPRGMPSVGLGDEVTEKLGVIEDLVNSLASRITALEMRQTVETTVNQETIHVHRLPSSEPRPPSANLWLNPMKDLEIVLKEEPAAPPPKVAAAAVPDVIKAKPMEVKPIQKSVPTNTPAESDDENEVEGEVEEETEEADVEGEVEEEAEAEEAEEEEDAEAEEEEEEAVELTEFTFKNRTFYRDGENQVYGLDEAGEIKEDPIGTWDETRQRVLFKRVA